MADQDETQRKPAPASGRRSVLNWLLGTWSAGVMGAIVFPIARYLDGEPAPKKRQLSVGPAPDPHGRGVGVSVSASW